VAQTISVIISLAERGDDQNVVTLSTLHAAKGLEWPHVILASVNEGLLPFAATTRRRARRARGRAPADVRRHHASRGDARSERAEAQEARPPTGTALPSRFIAEMKLDEVKRLEDPRAKLMALRAARGRTGESSRRLYIPLNKPA
jgi:ATP-dependent DNA helicase Rep